MPTHGDSKKHDKIHNTKLLIVLTSDLTPIKSSNINKSFLTLSKKPSPPFPNPGYAPVNRPIQYLVVIFNCLSLKITLIITCRYAELICDEIRNEN